MVALTLLRTVTGDMREIEVEFGMMKAAAHMLGEDGLYYRHICGRPWALTDSIGRPVTTGTAFSTGVGAGEKERVDQNPTVMAAGQFSDAYSCGRMLLAMTLR